MLIRGINMSSDAKILEKVASLEKEINSLKELLLERRTGKKASIGGNKKKAVKELLKLEMEFGPWEEEKRKLVEGRAKEIDPSGH
jgi:hypothetical protein